MPDPSAPHAPSSAALGVGSGVGLVSANMIGAGVFLSAGYMAQDMGPGPLLLAWLFGAFLALCGALTYAELASRVGRSGGEYRYLSELIHPAVGHLAGWASLVLGFAAPVALDAYAAGAFLNTVVPGPDPRLTGAILIVGLTLVHALHSRWSKWAQNALVAVKVLLVLGFVAVGLAAGSQVWPTWTPPHGEAGRFPWAAFLENQLWIAFAFSGWNAAIYAAGEFRRPRRDVPRAMLLGCGGVGLLYLLVNWVFVANLTPAQASAVLDHEQTRITLGHLVMSNVMGPAAASLMSLVAVIAFISAISAMTFVGPRVYAAMAEDGALPRVLGAREGVPPVGSVVLQGSLALALLFSQSVLSVVESAGAALLLFSGLCAVSLFRLRSLRPDLPPPSPLRLAAAGVYAVSVLGILYAGFSGSGDLPTALGVVAVLGLAAFATTRAAARATPARSSP